MRCANGAGLSTTGGPISVRSSSDAEVLHVEPVRADEVPGAIELDVERRGRAERLGRAAGEERHRIWRVRRVAERNVASELGDREVRLQREGWDRV
jgi:hypothetical protein